MRSERLRIVGPDFDVRPFCFTQPAYPNLEALEVCYVFFEISQSFQIITTNTHRRREKDTTSEQ